MDPYAWSWNAEALVILGLTVAYLAAVRQNAAGAWRVAAFLGAMLLLLAFGMSTGTTLYFEAALVIGMLGFVSTAALAKFLLRGEVIE